MSKKAISTKRLFVEIDKTNEHNEWELSCHKNSCRRICDRSMPDTEKQKDEKFWWKTVDNARFQPKLFEYIQKADEIYMSTSIMPLVGGTSIGSPETWHAMLQAAAKTGLSGKKVFISRPHDDIYWENLDHKLVSTVFKNNELYTISPDDRTWVKEDIKKLVKEIKERNR